MSTEADYTYDVFISYSHANQAWVRGELLPYLKSAGLRVCIDYRDFEIGAPIVTEMRRGLTDSRRTLLILTPDYLESDWTGFEQLMLQTLDPSNRQRRLIPLMREACDLPLEISYLNYLDFAAPDDWELAWSRLLKALQAPVQQGPPIPAPKKTSKQSPKTKASTRDARTRDLRHKLMDRCSLGDLKDLCFVMDIDYDNYPGGKGDFIRDLLKDLGQQGRLDEFERTLDQEKPWVLR
jgi:hypothetical protein